MEYSAEIKLAIIMRICGLPYRQDSQLMPWAFYDLACAMKLNPIDCTANYFVCDVPSFIQEHFYFEVIDNVALRATFDVSTGIGSKLMIQGIIRLGLSNIRLHRLIDWREYYSIAAETILMCENIYSAYLKIGLSPHELMVMQQLTNSKLQRFHLHG